MLLLSYKNCEDPLSRTKEWWWSHRVDWICYYRENYESRTIPLLLYNVKVFFGRPLLELIRGCWCPKPRIIPDSLESWKITRAVLILAPLTSKIYLVVSGLYIIIVSTLLRFHSQLVNGPCTATVAQYYVHYIQVYLIVQFQKTYTWCVIKPWTATRR